MGLTLATVTRPLDWTGGWRLEDLNLWEAGHVYTHRPTGRRLFGVTSIMRDNALGFDPSVIDAATLEAALFRGRFVHRAVQLHVAPENGATLDLEGLGRTHPAMAGYVQSYILRAEAERLRVTHAEHRLYDPRLWYAGTPDLIGLSRGERVLIDLKTGAAPDVDLQLAAYAHLWRVWQSSLTIERGECWRLRKDGRAAEIERYPIDEPLQDFIAALRMTLRRIAHGRTLAPEWCRAA